jgi:hypothetical protein
MPPLFSSKLRGMILKLPASINDWYVFTCGAMSIANRMIINNLDKNVRLSFIGLLPKVLLSFKTIV